MDGVLMRALVVHEYGAAPQVEDAPEPELREGQAIVEMRAAALNPVDLAIAGGGFYAYRPDVPFVVGREGVGRVVEGTTLAPGTRVQTVKAIGSMGERFVAEESDLWMLPDGDDDVEAAALGIAGLAGWVAVKERGRMAAGDRVLVLGGSGVVGLVAVQAAKLLGASRVVAAGRDNARLQRAVELGADATVELTGDLEAAFASAFPDGGPDLVIDPLWGEPAVAAMKAGEPGMRHVNLGQSAGAEATLASAVVRGKRIEIIGHTVFALRLDELSAAHTEMLGHMRSGSLTIDIETVALAHAADAWDRERAGAHTKLVVTP
jgi:NADPH:quinone reductase